MKKQSVVPVRLAVPVLLGLMLCLSGCVSNQAKTETQESPQVAEKAPEPVVKAAPAVPAKPVCKEAPKPAKKTSKKSQKAESPVVDCVPATAAQPAEKPSAVIVQSALEVAGPVQFFPLNVRMKVSSKAIPLNSLQSYAGEFLNVGLQRGQFSNEGEASVRIEREKLKAAYKGSATLGRPHPFFAPSEARSPSNPSATL